MKTNAFGLFDGADMTDRIAYTVRCSFTDPAVADRWIAWIRDPHMADVVAAGADSATLVELDRDDESAPRVCEVRYLFADRAAFARYEAEEAPRLREDGLSRFPLKLGLTYSRTVGVIRRCSWLTAVRLSFIAAPPHSSVAGPTGCCHALLRDR